MTTRVLILLVLLAGAALAVPAEDYWDAKVERSLEAARIEGRPAVLYFTLDFDETSHETFLRMKTDPAVASLMHGFIRVIVDQPDLNYGWAHYRISELPALVVLDPAGRKVALVTVEPHNDSWIARLDRACKAARACADHAVRYDPPPPVRHEESEGLVAPLARGAPASQPPAHGASQAPAHAGARTGGARRAAVAGRHGAPRGLREPECDANRMGEADPGEAKRADGARVGPAPCPPRTGWSQRIRQVWGRAMRKATNTDEQAAEPPRRAAAATQKRVATRASKAQVARVRALASEATAPAPVVSDAQPATTQRKGSSGNVAPLSTVPAGLPVPIATWPEVPASGAATGVTSGVVSGMLGTPPGSVSVGSGATGNSPSVAASPVSSQGGTGAALAPAALDVNGGVTGATGVLGASGATGVTGASGAAGSGVPAATPAPSAAALPEPAAGAAPAAAPAVSIPPFSAPPFSAPAFSAPPPSAPAFSAPAPRSSPASVPVGAASPYAVLTSASEVAQARRAGSGGREANPLELPRFAASPAAPRPRATLPEGQPVPPSTVSRWFAGLTASVKKVVQFDKSDD